MRRCLLALTIVFCGFSVSGQKLVENKPIGIKIKNPIVCYAAHTNKPLHVPPPEEYIRWKNNPGAKTKTANIEVQYVGFPDDVGGIGPHAAFQAAVEIWETLLTSSETIRIEARWTTLGQGVLGSAIYTSAFANFSGAQKLNVFYPVAIAEKITGQDMNDGEPDLVANFNSGFDWHLDPNTNPAGKYDLMTVVLHEIGHGLGFAGTMSVAGTQGSWGLSDTEVPIIYDAFLETGSGADLIASFNSPSADLRTQLTSQNLFFTSPINNQIKIYAPATFNGGSSISHIDETTFNGTPNALMTPQIGASEKINDPGVALSMLKDLGWEYVRIHHDPFPGSEAVAGTYPITVTIDADNGGYLPTTVKLNHTLDGTNFTAVTMTATGNPNEFTANIPATGVADEYGYFISVNNAAGRQFINPGKIVRENNTQLQDVFFFETGPDTQAPKLTHSPKGFLLEEEDELVIDAKVTDNLGVESVMVEYYKNDVLQGTEPLELIAPEEDSIYSATLDLSGLNLVNGDQIKYRITATDVAVIGAVNGNIAYSPSPSTFHTVNVVGLEPTQDSYANDFNTVSDDFFGTGFSIPAVNPNGFTNGAIHTEHPYLEGTGFPNDERHLVYQLKIPIRVKGSDATIKFDEVVLVEPGEAGSVFGDPNFFDYVVVEGSTNGGLIWKPIADGYDARDNSAWLTRYNSATSGNNSTATGDASLFRTRTLNLLDEFDENDEVVIRFRLFSDPFAAGWGWCIDNLKIQVDETPPLVLNDHIDYMFDADDAVDLTTKVSDGSGVKSLKLEYFINSGSVVTEIIDVDPPQDEYPITLSSLSGLAVGDVFNYRLVAVDSSDLEGTFPPTGFIKVPVIEFQTPVTTYANNFNNATTDFVGNFFSQAQPTGFNDQAVHSSHFYSNGIGLDQTSDYTYMLKKPITIADENTYISFDEIVIVQSHAFGATFGSAEFNDYVVVEGSKDNGVTWHPFADGYDAFGVTSWETALTNQSNGTSSLFRRRSIDLTASGDFVSDDNVLIRFRMFADATSNGWGWAIDNLYIQDPITDTENALERAVSVYPNPAKGNITVESEGVASSFIIQLTSTSGKNMYRANAEAIDGKMTHTISTAIPAGIYFVKVSDGLRTVVKKVVKLD